MKAFFKKYSLELNLVLTALFLSTAIMFWIDFFEEQKGRSMLRGIMFSIFSITRGWTVYSIWAQRRQSLKEDYEGIENQKHLE